MGSASSRMTTQAEWLSDLADTAADLGLRIRAVNETSVVLIQGNDVTITVESHFLSGRMLRSVLRPRADPAAAE